MFRGMRMFRGIRSFQYVQAIRHIYDDQVKCKHVSYAETSHTPVQQWTQSEKVLAFQ